MFGEFLNIIFKSIKLDKSLYSDSKNFGEASIYFAGLIMILDGKCIKSCSLLAVQCNKKSIKTIESIGKENNLSNVQKAFNENHGLQCGFCTPGFIMTAIECKKNNISTEEEVREFLDGNFCRCTGYQNIVKSIISFLKMS